MSALAVTKTTGASLTREVLAPTVGSLLGTLVALLPSNPANLTLPSRDSGVFLYMGWRMLNGEIPFRDVWDHKPPLIYFVDALGLHLTPQSLWGVWALQFLFIFITFFLIYRLLDREFGTLAALSGCIILTSGLLTILERGNVTEEYALPFQALCFALFLVAWKKDFPVMLSFWIGLAGGLAFHFKQTTIGIWITYGLFLLAARLLQRRPPSCDLLPLLAGFSIPTLAFIAYFANQHALRDYWEQAFLYNFVYIGKHEGIRRLIPVFVKGFAYLKNGWVLYFAVVGWLAGLTCTWLCRKHVSEIHPLILIALVNLPIEIVLILVSGRSILHYYLTLLPVMAILSGALVYTMQFLAGRTPSLRSRAVRQCIPGIVLLAILVGQHGQARYYPEYVRILSDNDYAPVIEYVVNHTDTDDTVLLIGAESVVNFLARREAPTRYVYQYPLALLGQRPMFEEYFNEILRERPTLIIDTRGRTRLDDRLYTSLQKRSQIVRDGVKYLTANYKQVAQFGDWFVYRFVGKN